MALTIKGTPQKVKVVGSSISDVSQGSSATAAVKAAKLMEDEDAKRSGGKHGGRKTR